MPFTIVRNDITKMQTDAIVNAANTRLEMGGGVCGAIFKAAGVRQLEAACKPLSPIQTGEAVITPGFELPAKYILHTAGPVYRGGGQGEAALLRACYESALALAVEQGCESIALPLISSGIFGYPKHEALRIATDAIHRFLESNDMDIYLAVFDTDSFIVSEQLLGDVSSYIDGHYVDAHATKYRQTEILELFRETSDEDDKLATAEEQVIEALQAPMPAAAKRAEPTIDDLIGNLDEPFADTLLRIIDASGKTDAEVYKRANLDRRLFSKIRNVKNYMPGKRTVIALAIALELSLLETTNLLGRAGYALSRSQRFDVIIEYFVSNGKYDIFEINEVLFYYDQPLLGG